MQRALRLAAIALALLNAAILTGIQLGPVHPPLVFFLVFAGVWLFGAAMLWWFPTFGAIGTALYGAILAVDLLSMHGRGVLNDALAVTSVAAAVLAIATLVARRRGSA